MEKNESTIGDRVRGNEKDIESIQREMNSFKSRIDKQGVEIDQLSSNYKDFGKEIALIAQATQFSGITLKEIKSDIKLLAKDRENDHFVKPLANNAKLVWLVIGVVVSLLIAFLLRSLFPILVVQ